MADGEVYEVGQRMEAELEHDISAVGFDSPNGDAQQRGDLLIRFSRSQKANNFDLACSRFGM